MILNRNAIIVRPLKAQSNNNLINDDTNDVMTFTGNDNANAFNSIAIGFKSPQLVHKTPKRHTERARTNVLRTKSSAIRAHRKTWETIFACQMYDERISVCFVNLSWYVYVMLAACQMQRNEHWIDDLWFCRYRVRLCVCNQIPSSFYVPIYKFDDVVEGRGKREVKEGANVEYFRNSNRSKNGWRRYTNKTWPQCVTKQNKCVRLIANVLE